MTAPGGGAGGLAQRIEAFVDAVGRATSWIALVIVLVMATNVLLRYLLSMGSVWSQELEWHLLVPLVLFGMSYAMRHGEHVRIDIVYARLGAIGRARVDLLAAVLTGAIAIGIAWLSLKYVGQSWTIGERSSDPGGLPYRYLLKALIPAGFMLLALQALATGLAAAGRLREASR